MKKETEQIRALYLKTKAALAAFDNLDGFEKTITEPEVRFRFETVSGFLIMAVNDIGRCLQTWVIEDIEEAVQNSPQNGRGANNDRNP